MKIRYVTIGVILLALLLLASCSRFREVTIIEQEESGISTEQTEYLRAKPPKIVSIDELGDHVSLPLEVVQFRKPIDDDIKSLEVVELEIDSESRTLTVVTHTGRVTTMLPAVGETKTIRPGEEAALIVDERVSGEPEEIEHTTKIEKEGSFFGGIKNLIIWFAILAGLIGVIIVIVKLIPSWKYRAIQRERGID